MRLALFSTFFLLCFAACGGSTTPEPRTVTAGPSAPEVTAEDAGAPPPRAPAEPPHAQCQSDHVWDDTAKACRMFPGGGYGWAGCSISKKPPPHEQCVTGTHWEPCDCACDAANTKWNAESKRCE